MEGALQYLQTCPVEEKMPLALWMKADLDHEIKRQDNQTERLVEAYFWVAESLEETKAWLSAGMTKEEYKKNYDSTC